MLPPLDASAPYLVIATALLQFESSLVVSIALMSEEIWSSCCYVVGTRDGVREIHTAGLSCCSSGMSFFSLSLSFFSAFLSCWLQKTGQGWMRGGSAGRGVSIVLTLSLSLSSICILRCSIEWSQRGGSSSALQMNAFSILVVLIKCVCVCVCVCVEGGGRSPGGCGGLSVTQSGSDQCQAHENGVREQERRRGEMKGRQHKEEKSSVLPVTWTPLWWTNSSCINNTTD